MLRVMKPNILYLHSHDSGRYFSPYGYAVETPTFAALADRGTLFRQAFCAAPTCTPSRVALLTGMSPHTAGVLGLAHRGFGLTDGRHHLVTFLKSHGYHTALVGIQHEAANAAVLGYDQDVQPPHLPEMAGRRDTATAAIEVLKQRRGEGKPFFLSVGFFETHEPYPPASVDPNRLRAPVPLPDTPHTRKDFAAFTTDIQRLDGQYGRILQALQDAGLADDTLVLVTTDHGPPFPFMKCNLTDHGTGVAMLLYAGRNVPQAEAFNGGKTVDAMVSHMDVFPTLCEVLDVPRPEWLQCRSLLPLLRGETEALHEALFAEVTYHAAYEPMRAVRTPRYRYIRRYSERGRPVLPNIDGSHSKSLLIDHGLADHALPGEALYDLLYDPAETNNRIGDAGLAGVADDLRARLDAWMVRTADPLLEGTPGIPAGATATETDALHPAGPLIKGPAQPH